MLNFAMKGTYQDSAGYGWDYYRDDQLDPNPDPNAFYIIPKPQFVLDDSGKPSFQIIRYATDDKTTNGAGHVRFDVELSVAANVSDAIANAILQNPTKFPNVSRPNFITLAFNRGGKAYFAFSSGASPITFSAPVASFGGDEASFLLEMTKEQIDTVIAAFTAKGGAFEVQYHLSAAARLQGASADLSFDSSIAYSYQVTQPTYNSWGDETSPRTVQAFLNESAASKVNVTFSVANPPQYLEDDVTDWANKTLADLVSAEVQKVIQLQGINSDTSFNINEVSSFKSSFAENMVIDWIISPAAALPSFTDQGWDIKQFTQTVNEQQQMMSVTVNLPFKSSRMPEVALPGGLTAHAVVAHATVTVSYPGLPQAGATQTFTSNGTKTFTAPYDPGAGPAWSLQYEVTYTDPNMQAVSGSVSNITEANYSLEVEAAGILTVVFDASEAFATESVRPTSITVDLTFTNRSGNGNAVRQQTVIEAPPSSGTQTAGAGTGSITSFVADPISTPYNYQLTYTYAGGVPFKPPLVQGETGFNVRIPAADAVHETTVVVYEPAGSDDDENPVDSVSVQMWYASPPTVSTLPGVVTISPTKASPAVYTIKPVSMEKPAYATFVGFVNGDQPLMYSASITSPDPPQDVDEQPIDNGQARLQINPNVSYFTLQIDPVAVDWSKVNFDLIEVIIQMNKVSPAQMQNVSPARGSRTQPGKAATGKPLGREQTYQWNKSDPTDSKYFTTFAHPDDTITYDWTVNYVTKGKGVQTTTGLGETQPIFNIPATPPA